ncbi:hypothetical protein CSKR_109762 [Clonorchis sinensis]|uniref:Uncharacterized protein n=1 Tax=Clonorchis sinensis TaxID=79923 RepID=A0A3R7CJM5_CLOSI|nr:hypothetical protein CSKR_109762 [Clonorchis sinensis]
MCRTELKSRGHGEKEEGLHCGQHPRTVSTTTKLNIHLLLERVFLNCSGYSLTVTQIQANSTKRLRQLRNRSHFSRDAKLIYERMYYSHASSVVSTVKMVVPSIGGLRMLRRTDGLIVMEHSKNQSDSS